MLIPGMKTAIDVSTEYGVESVVIGMPHRGRYVLLGFSQHNLNIFPHNSKLTP